MEKYSDENIIRIDKSLERLSDGIGYDLYPRGRYRKLRALADDLTGEWESYRSQILNNRHKAYCRNKRG